MLDITVGMLFTYKAAYRIMPIRAGRLTPFVAGDFRQDLNVEIKWSAAPAKDENPCSSAIDAWSLPPLPYPATPVAVQWSAKGNSGAVGVNRFTKQPAVLLPILSFSSERVMAGRWLIF